MISNLILKKELSILLRTMTIKDVQVLIYIYMYKNDMHGIVFYS